MCERVTRPLKRGVMPLRIILRVLTFIIVLTSSALAQDVSLPRFEDYPAAKGFSVKPVAAVIAGEQARYYRTRIRRRAKDGPNFGGHYTVVTWGCGSGCLRFAVVDARTGRVYFNPKATNVSTVPHQDEDSLQFRLDSRLLVVSGVVFGLKHEQTEAKFYFEWRNHRFRLLKKTRIKIDKPIPLSLIKRIVKFRVKENLERAKAKVVRK